MHKLPNSLKTAFMNSPPFSKPLAFFALKDLFTNNVINTDESLYSFVNRRFGIEMAKYAADPMVRGIFAGSARELSVHALAGRLHSCEQKYGSVLKGLIRDRKNVEKPDTELMKSELVQKARKEKWAVWSVSGGLENLVKALEQKLLIDGVEIRRNTAVRSIIKSGKNLAVQTAAEELEVEKVVSCVGSNKLSTQIHSTSLELSALLGSIPFVTCGVVNLEFPGQLLSEAGFGYLVPSSEPNKVLGVIFDTCTFPQGDRTILTVMMGGYWFNSHFGDNPSHESLLEIALSEIKETLKIDMQPLHYRVSILRDCIPQYVVGHSETVVSCRKIIHDQKLPLNLAGYCYDGVGVNDAIMSAKRAVS